jgi:hypothetical protein
VNTVIKPGVSHKAGKFVEWLSYWRFLNKGSAPRS